MGVATPYLERESYQTFVAALVALAEWMDAVEKSDQPVTAPTGESTAATADFLAAQAELRTLVGKDFLEAESLADQPKPSSPVAGP